MMARMNPSRALFRTEADLIPWGLGCKHVLMDIRLDLFLDGYKMFLLDQRGLSRETYRAYVNDIEDLLGFLREREIDVPDRAQVRSYMLRLHSGYNRSSINRKLSSIKGFFDFVLSRADIGLNPFSHVRSLKKQEVLPKFLTPDEIIDLIDAVQDLRDRAILELLYSTGIRVGEVEKMNCMDIEKLSGFILVMGKGSKQRRVPVGKRALAAVMEYLRGRGIEDPLYSSEPLFLNSRGKRLSTRSIRRIMDRWAETAALSRHVSPHVIRHT
ncbi:hypothetical protein EG829_13465, partial [bacterium]|nr:hypothetical protein [bacterium]